MVDVVYSMAGGLGASGVDGPISFLHRYVWACMGTYGWCFMYLCIYVNMYRCICVFIVRLQVSMCTSKCASCVYDRVCVYVWQRIHGNAWFRLVGFPQPWITDMSFSSRGLWALRILCHPCFALRHAMLGWLLRRWIARDQPFWRKDGRW